MKEDYYSRFSEKEKIRLLNERDNEIYNADKKIDELECMIKDLKIKEKALKSIKKQKANHSKLKLPRGEVYKSDIIEVSLYTTDEETEYFELNHPNIANELFKDSYYHNIETSKVRVYIEIF